MLMELCNVITGVMSFIGWGYLVVTVWSFLHWEELEELAKKKYKAR